MLPNALIIGCQKAGTTSLHNWLQQHPEVYGPLEYKDKDYFVSAENLAEIRQRFALDYKDYQEQKIVLQSQVNYILYKQVIQRIHQLNPEMKLIVILRDPIERAISGYKYFKKMQREKRPPEKALLYKPRKFPLTYSRNTSDFTYLEHGMYGQQLEEVFKLFPARQVLVLSFEQLKEDPQEIMKKACVFLQIDARFRFDFKRKNQTGQLHSAWLQKQLFRKSGLKRKLIKYLVNWWLPAPRRKRLKQELMEINTKKNDLVKKDNSEFEEIRKQLTTVFAEDQKRLRRILNQKYS